MLNSFDEVVTAPIVESATGGYGCDIVEIKLDVCSGGARRTEGVGEGGRMCVLESGVVEKGDESRVLCEGTLERWWDFRTMVASPKSTSVEVGFCLMIVPVAHRWLGVG